MTGSAYWGFSKPVQGWIHKSYSPIHTDHRLSALENDIATISCQYFCWVFIYLLVISYPISLVYATQFKISSYNQPLHISTIEWNRLLKKLPIAPKINMNQLLFSTSSAATISIV